MKLGQHISWTRLTCRSKILDESGFWRLQKHGFQWNILYQEKMHLIVFHPDVRLLFVIPRVMTIYAVTTLHDLHPKVIHALVQKATTNQLKLLSQNSLKNCFAEVWFCLHMTRIDKNRCWNNILAASKFLTEAKLSKQKVIMGWIVYISRLAA
jgi:hypothetical protein